MGRRKPSTQRGFGAYIREARDAKGYSQAELGEYLGLSASSVSNLENEQVLPALETVNGLALNLGLSPVRMLELAGVRLDVPPAGRLPREFVEDFLALPQEQQLLVIGLTHGLRFPPEE